MNIEFEMLKAQYDSLRTYFISLLPVIFEHDGQQKIDGSKTWLAKYLLWGFERENLSALDCKFPPSSPGSERISRRRFQLQVLMDVAYIQGGLGAYDILWKIAPDDYALAEKVFHNSDGSEEQMLLALEKLSPR